MSGDLEQLAPHDVRRVDERIAAFQILVAHPVFNLFADDAALGMKEDQPGTGQLLDAEQVKFLAELPVIAFLGFFELGEILVELFVGEERGAVDALELLIVLVAFPIGAGDGKQLERFDL